MRQFLLFGMLMSVFAVYAQQDQPKVIRNFNDDGINGISVSYQINDMAIHREIINGQQFHRINIKDFSYLHREGKPALPSNRDMILIPENIQAKINLTILEADTFSNITAWPAQQPHSDEDEQQVQQHNFIMDSAFYNQDIYYPQKAVDLKQDQKIRNMAVGVVHVTPFRYNPVKKELILLRKFRYEISFPGASSFFDDISRHSHQYLQTLPSKFINSSSVSSEIRKHTASVKSSASDYIIISHTDFSMAADTLARWKHQLGYRVSVIKRSFWTPAMIRDTLSHLYHNSSAYPDYFVILGDQQFVPAMLVNPSKNRYSDLYYACMDSVNDYYPDMAHGRITAKSQLEALDVVKKIRNYEQSPPSSPSFYNTALNCAYFQDDDTSGYASRRFVHTSEEVRNYLLSLNYNVNRVYYTDPWVTPTHYNPSHYSSGQPLPADLLRFNGFNWDGDGQDVVNEINNGRFIVLHRDHGYTNGWSEPDLSSAQIPSMTNGEELPVVFSINCSSGNFIADKCFAEKLLHRNNGGAVGVIAASATSYSGYNDGFSTGLFDAIWANPGLIPAFGNGGIQNPNITPHGNIRTMGDVLNHGLLRMTQTWGDSRTSHELFHYHGDPSMRIHTHQPAVITASHQDTLICDSMSLQIYSSSKNDAVATLVMGDTLLDRIQLISGTGTLQFPAVSNLYPYATLTISAEGYRPYVAQIPVTGCSNPPLADIFIKDTILSCFSSSTWLYDKSAYQPLSVSWQFTPSQVTYLSGNASAKNIHVQFADTGYYDVRLIAGNPFGTDTLLQNKRIYVYPAQPAPYTETAEQFSSFGYEDSLWNRYSNSGYEWRIHQDSTPSFTTGPIVDHTTGTSQGHYFYTEASSGNKGDSAILTSPVVNIGNLNNPALSFWYHMFGAEIDVLYVEVSAGAVWHTLAAIHGTQQTAYDDPWINKMVDLSAYKGECIKIRFTAIRGSNYHGDIAIDDIALIDHSSAPAAAFSATDRYTCCGHQVSFEDLSCCGTTAREWTFPGGNPQTSSMKKPVVTYDTAGFYSVTLKIQNNFGQDSLVKYYHITVKDNQDLPLAEDFESFYPGNPGIFQNDWFTEKSHKFNWRVNNGSTPTSQTGPAFDHTKGNMQGNYVYTEASYVTGGQKAWLISPCINIPENHRTYLTFWTHMFGSGIDTLYVDVNDGHTWNRNVFKIGGELQQSITDNWQQMKADLSAFAGKNIQFRFRSIRRGSYHDDKAIDDVLVTAGQMKIRPDTINFGYTDTNQVVTDSITIINTSIDTLLVSNFSLPAPFQLSSPSNLAIPPGDSVSLEVTFNPSSASNYQGVLKVVSDINPDSVFLAGHGSNVGLEFTGKDVRLEIFPNPASEKLFIKAGGIQGKITCLITDARGSTIDRRELTTTAREVIVLDINMLSAGIYSLQIISDQQIITERFIRE